MHRRSKPEARVCVLHIPGNRRSWRRGSKKLSCFSGEEARGVLRQLSSDMRGKFVFRVIVPCHGTHEYTIKNGKLPDELEDLLIQREKEIESGEVEHSGERPCVRRFSPAWM